MPDTHPLSESKALCGKCGQEEFEHRTATHRFAAAIPINSEGGSRAAGPLLQPDVADYRVKQIEQDIEAIRAAQVALLRAKQRAKWRANRDTAATDQARKWYAAHGCTLDNIPDAIAALYAERAAILAAGER